MAFALRDDQIEQSWATLKLEIVFAPRTGNIKPWEIHARFTYPHPMKKHWGSFKTEAAANLKLEALKIKYPQAA
jgi:hypothetical protein